MSVYLEPWPRSYADYLRSCDRDRFSRFHFDFFLLGDISCVPWDRLAAHAEKTETLLETGLAQCRQLEACVNRDYPDTLLDEDFAADLRAAALNGGVPWKRRWNWSGNLRQHAPTACAKHRLTCRMATALREGLREGTLPDPPVSGDAYAAVLSSAYLSPLEKLLLPDEEHTHAAVSTQVSALQAAFPSLESAIRSVGDQATVQQEALCRCRAARFCDEVDLVIALKSFSWKVPAQLESMAELIDSIDGGLPVRDQTGLRERRLHPSDQQAWTELVSSFELMVRFLQDAGELNEGVERRARAGTLLEVASDVLCAFDGEEIAYYFFKSLLNEFDRRVVTELGEALRILGTLESSTAAKSGLPIERLIEAASLLQWCLGDPRVKSWHLFCGSHDEPHWQAALRVVGQKGLVPLSSRLDLRYEQRRSEWNHFKLLLRAASRYADKIRCQKDAAVKTSERVLATNVSWCRELLTRAEPKIEAVEQLAPGYQYFIPILAEGELDGDGEAPNAFLERACLEWGAKFLSGRARAKYYKALDAQCRAIQQELPELRRWAKELRQWWQAEYQRAWEQCQGNTVEAKLKIEANLKAEAAQRAAGQARKQREEAEWERQRLPQAQAAPVRRERESETDRIQGRASFKKLLAAMLLLLILIPLIPAILMGIFHLVGR